MAAMYLKALMCLFTVVWWFSHSKAQPNIYGDRLQIPRAIFRRYNNPQTPVVNTSLLQGSCYQFKPTEDERCKFYSDCCPMAGSRLLEQLPMGTFSCQDGFYVVDKCPTSWDRDVTKHRCEEWREGTSELSLTKWPLRNTLSQLVYKNVYCALCNGFNITENVTTQAGNYSFSLDWWMAKVDCPLDSIKEYLGDATKAELLSMIDRDCEVIYIPPLIPDSCISAVRNCPQETRPDARSLCEEGPANYLIDTKTNVTYRNQFCAECNNVNLVLYQEAYPATYNQNQTLLFIWTEGKLQQRTEHNENSPDGSSVTLAFIRPKINNKILRFQSRNLASIKRKLGTECFFSGDMTYCASLDSGRGQSSVVPDEVQQPSDRSTEKTQEQEFSKCRSSLLTSLWNSTLDTESSNDCQNGTASESYGGGIWDLGSIECWSDVKSVCDLFIAYNIASSPRCASPGCPDNFAQEPTDNSCVDLNIVKNARKQVVTRWPASTLCDHLSSCRLVDMGLLELYQLNCYCDDMCVYYNDCCFDAPAWVSRRGNETLPVGTVTCSATALNYTKGFQWGLSEVFKCPATYTDTRIKALCEQHLLHMQSPMKSLDVRHWPVSDRATKVRYANIYCAKCHGILEVAFWKAIYGCVKISAVNCNSLNKVKSLQGLLFNTSTKSLKDVSEHCDVKGFQPPDESFEARQCKITIQDSEVDPYVDTCPQEYADWEISKQCLSSPTSFIYSPEINRSYLGGTRDGHTNTYFYGDDLRLVFFSAGTTYRNHFCATCRAAPLLGCVLRTYAANNDSLLEEYVNGLGSYVFLYIIDLQKRSCERDSNYYLTYANETTGRDTCDSLAADLRRCNCSEVFDIEVGHCVQAPVDYLPQCYTQFSPIIRKPSSYLFTCSDVAHSNYSITDSNTRIRLCSACAKSRTCAKVYGNISVADFQLGDRQLSSPSVYCSVERNILLPRCHTHQPCVMMGIGATSAIAVESPGEKIILSNSVAISRQDLTFDQSSYLNQLASHQSALSFLFSSNIQQSEQAYCNKYDVSDGQFLVCPNNQLEDINGSRYSDFFIKGENISVCTNVNVIGFYLSTYDYVLCSLSMAVVVTYLIDFILRKKKTLIGFMMASTLVTLFVAILFFCLVSSATSVPSACKALAIAVQFAFLSTHFWTSSIAILTFRGLKQMRAATGKRFKSYLPYAAYAWGSPFLFVFIAIAIDKLEVKVFQPVYLSSYCFISNTNYVRLLVFTGPIYLLIFTNVVLCVASAITIMKSGSTITKDERHRLKRNILTCWKLMVIFGVHWILLPIAEIEWKYSNAIWTLLTVFIELQGVLIVVSQFVTWKRIMKVKKQICRVTIPHQSKTYGAVGSTANLCETSNGDSDNQTSDSNL